MLNFGTRIAVAAWYVFARMSIAMRVNTRDTVRTWQMSDQELLAHRTGGNSLLEAERIFRDKFEKAQSKQHSLQINNSKNPVSLDTADEDIFRTAIQRNQTQENFEKEQFQKLREGISPEVQLYLCVQLDVNMGIVVPGLKVNLGLLGSVHYDTGNKCWGWTLEASIGLSYGLKIYGYGVGIGVSFTGGLDLQEVAIQHTQKNTSLLSDFAPQGADLSMCHSSDPWAVIMAYIHRAHMKTMTSDEIKTTLESKIADLHSDPKIADFDLYRQMLVDPASVQLSAESTLAALELFSRQVPRYASAALERLADNYDSFGTDGFLNIFSTQAGRRLSQAAGRYCARWPGNRELHEHGEAKPVGVSHEQDQRTMNFIKVLRLADDRHSNYVFWKEMAISTANVFVRLIGDVQALFNIYLADDPYWDGSCQSLPASFNILYEYGNGYQPPAGGMTVVSQDRMRTARNSTLNSRGSVVSGQDDPFQRWPWISKERKPDLSAMFARSNQPDGASAAGGKLFPDLAATMYPHVWCELAMAQKAQAAKRDGLRVRVQRACRTVQPSASIVGQWIDTNQEAMTIDSQHHAVWPNGLDEELTVHGLEEDEESFVIRPVKHWRDISKGSIVRISSSESQVIEAARASGITSHFDGRRKKTAGQLVTVMEMDAKDKTLKVMPINLANADGQDVWHGFGALDGWASRFESRHGTLDGFGWRRVASEKVVKMRWECEEVVLSAPIVRVLPTFVEAVETWQHFMEARLREINECLEEQLVGESDEIVDDDLEAGLVQAQEICHAPPSAQRDEARKQFVKARTLRMLQKAREALIRLGGLHQENMGPLAPPALMPLSKLRRELGPKSAGDIISVLRQGFETAFGFSSDTGPLDGFWTQLPVATNSILDNLDHLKEQVYTRLMRQRREQALGQVPALAFPPVEYTHSLSLTAQLAENGFCTPNTGLVVVQGIQQTTGNTWSEGVNQEHCFLARLRPGDLYIQVQRCQGVDNQLGLGHYADWRIRFLAVLVKGDVLTSRESGMLGNILTKPGPVTNSIAFSAASLAGGAMSASLVERLGPIIHNDQIFSAMLLVLTAATPLGATAAAVVGATGLESFETLCRAFLDQLSEHNVVQPLAELTPQPPIELNIQMALVTWGAVIYRLRNYDVSNTPWATTLGDVDGVLVRHEKITKVHVENWNRMRGYIDIPSVGGLDCYLKLELDFDLTPWLERSRNFLPFQENQKRIVDCEACLSQGLAFCDWKPVLGDRFRDEMDDCVPSSDFEADRCRGTTDTGAYATGDWYVRGGSSSCADLEFIRFNQGFPLSDAAGRFLRRH